MAEKLRIILFCWCFLLSGNSVWAEKLPAQHPSESVRPEPFNQSKWESLRKKVKINEAKPKPKTEKKVTREKKHFDPKLDPGTKMILLLSMFVILICVLLFLILYTLGINPFKKKKNGQKIRIGIEAITEHLDETDLDPLLMEAIKSGNYKLAIRLYYLQIVQRLHFAGKIRWKRFKTNKHYLNEMGPQPDYRTFKELTHLYEKCWFGPDLLNQNQYELIYPQFINYAKNLPAVE